MTVRCYFRKGTKEVIWGIPCETLVADESTEEELMDAGWRRSPLDLDAKEEPVDEVLQALRSAAKDREIKGWHRMGEAKLREVLGLNDGDEK